MVLLLACSGTPRAVHADADPYEAELAAVRYDLRVLSPDSSREAPVAVGPEDFQRTLRALAREIPATDQPMELARWLMEGELRADLQAEMERGRVVRLLPREDGSPLEAASAVELARSYRLLCQTDYGGGDCLGLFTDGPLLTRDDLRTLGLALSLKEVLRETHAAFRDMVSPQALVTMVVWTGCFYLLLWLLPEPVSKALAASMTLALLAWLPMHTVWSLMDGWARLVHEVDRATSYSEIEAASARFRKAMGEHTARVLVLLVTTALAGGAAKFAARLPKLPGFERAAAWAEAQGLKMSEANQVEAVAAAEERTFTLMVRRPGSGASSAEAAAEARAGITTIIRHQGGNRQVFINGQRWHVPANKSLKNIPAKDPMGDQLQAAATQVASRWSPRSMSPREAQAVAEARAQGEYWKAHLLEREARGRFVHRVMADQFRQFRWNPRGVDAVDPSTGYKYELLTQTASNMERHGRRIAEELFRMISF